MGLNFETCCKPQKEEYVCGERMLVNLFLQTTTFSDRKINMG
jgi:hypothetical protein